MPGANLLKTKNFEIVHNMYLYYHLEHRVRWHNGFGVAGFKDELSPFLFVKTEYENGEELIENLKIVDIHYLMLYKTDPIKWMWIAYNEYLHYKKEIEKIRSSYG